MRVPSASLMYGRRCHIRRDVGLDGGSGIGMAVRMNVLHVIGDMFVRRTSQVVLSSEVDFSGGENGPPKSVLSFIQLFV